MKKRETQQLTGEENSTGMLITKNPQKLIYTGKHVTIEVLGALPMDMSNMKVTVCMFKMHRIFYFFYIYLHFLLNKYG